MSFLPLKPPLRAGALFIRYKMWKTACKTARHGAELPLWSSAASWPSLQLQQRLNTKPHFLPTGKTVNAHLLTHSHFAIRTTPRNVNPASITRKAFVLTCDPDLGWDPWEWWSQGPSHPTATGCSLGYWDPTYRAESIPSPRYFNHQSRQEKCTAIKSARALQLGDFISASVSSTER